MTANIVIDTEKAQKLSEQCIAMLADRPNIDHKMLSEASGGKISDGNGLEHCKVLVNALDWLKPSTTTKSPIKRGKKTKDVAANSNGNGQGVDPNAPIKKRRGRKPKHAIEEVPVTAKTTETAQVTEETQAPTILPEILDMPDPSNIAEPLQETT